MKQQKQQEAQAQAGELNSREACACVSRAGESKDIESRMKKQNATNEAFADIWRRIERHISRAEVEDKIEATQREIARVTAGKKTAIAWSAGKDSMALDAITRPMGLTQGVFATCHLEYPAVEAWLTTHTPPDIETVRTSHDLNYLRDNPHMVFPKSSALIARWAQIKQIPVQQEYSRRNGLDVLIVGRRREDGNYIGTGPYGTHRKQGVETTVYCPLRDWTHAEVLGLLHYLNIELPPNYAYPHGWIVGSGSWVVHNYAKDGLDGWTHIYGCDPTVVMQAARVLPDARAFLERRARAAVFTAREGIR